MKHIRGFTLIEVMIVVAILSIVLALGIPNLRIYIANARIRGVASEMRDGLQTARMEAIRRNNKITIEISGAGWEIKDGPSDGSCPDASSSQTVIRSRAAKNQESALLTSFTDTDGTTTSITSAAKKILLFTGEGRLGCSSVSGTISIKQPGTDVCKTPTGGGDYNCLNVLVSPGGMIRTCNTATSGSPDSCT